MVQDPKLDRIISWNADGDTFIVHKPEDFAVDVLPAYFRHNNFCSFIRQLNTYGFTKVVQDSWAFRNEHFRRDQQALLELVKRRKSVKRSPEKEGFGSERTKFKPTTTNAPTTTSSSPLSSALSTPSVAYSPISVAAFEGDDHHHHHHHYHDAIGRSIRKKMAMEESEEFLNDEDRNWMVEAEVDDGEEPEVEEVIIVEEEKRRRSNSGVREHFTFTQKSEETNHSNNNNNDGTTDMDIAEKVNRLTEERSYLLEELGKLKQQQVTNEQMVEYFVAALKASRQRQQEAQEREQRMLMFLSQLLTPNNNHTNTNDNPIDKHGDPILRALQQNLKKPSSSSMTAAALRRRRPLSSLSEPAFQFLLRDESNNAHQNEREGSEEEERGDETPSSLSDPLFDFSNMHLSSVKLERTDDENYPTGVVPLHTNTSATSTTATSLCGDATPSLCGNATPSLCGNAPPSLCGNAPTIASSSSSISATSVYHNLSSSSASSSAATAALLPEFLNDYPFPSSPHLGVAAIDPSCHFLDGLASAHSTPLTFGEDFLDTLVEQQRQIDLAENDLQQPHLTSTSGNGTPGVVGVASSLSSSSSSTLAASSYVPYTFGLSTSSIPSSPLNSTDSLLSTSSPLDNSIPSSPILRHYLLYSSSSSSSSSSTVSSKTSDNDNSSSSSSSNSGSSSSSSAISLPSSSSIPDSTEVAIPKIRSEEDLSTFVHYFPLSPPIFQCPPLSPPSSSGSSSSSLSSASSSSSSQPPKSPSLCSSYEDEDECQQQHHRCLDAEDDVLWDQLAGQLQQLTHT
ncbi:Heat shock transcription factor [Balamuthia mandrillaris]